MTRQEVYQVIDSERNYQDTKWGGLAHDSSHTVGDFIIYMEHYLNKAKKEYSTALYTDEPALEELRKVTALGVALGEIFGYNYRIIKTNDNNNNN